MDSNMQPPDSPKSTESNQPVQPTLPSQPAEPAPQQSPMQEMQQTMPAATQPMEQIHSELPASPMEPEKKSSFSFGRVFLTLLIFLVIAALVGGAYYLGSKNNVSPVATVPEVTRVPTIAATATPAATSSSAMQTMTAGGVYTFAKYQVSVPSGWTTTHTTTSGDVVTIAKNNFQLTINQGAFDGGACSYPDKQITTGIVQSFTTFVEIKDQSGNMYRRGKVNSVTPAQSTDKYEVCAWSTKNNTYQEFTPFGRIDYMTPPNADAAILAQMDGVVATLKMSQ